MRRGSSIYYIHFSTKTIQFKNYAKKKHNLLPLLGKNILFLLSYYFNLFTQIFMQ